MLFKVMIEREATIEVNVAEGTPLEAVRNAVHRLDVHTNQSDPFIVIHGNKSNVKLVDEDRDKATIRGQPMQVVIDGKDYPV
jgi:hypothetical protein